jgi:hypothetical protein
LIGGLLAIASRLPGSLPRLFRDARPTGPIGLLHARFPCSSRAQPRRRASQRR